MTPLRDEYEKVADRAEYPPCAVCDGPNDTGEVCAKCAKTNNYWDVEGENSSGWRTL